MSERLKGEVAVKVDGETFTFRFGGAALMAIEEAFDAPFMDALSRLQSQASAGGLRIGEAAKVIKAGLRAYHPNLTLDDAADLVLAPGVQDAMSEAIMLAFPASDGGDGDADADPRRPRRGTGTKS